GVTVDARDGGPRVQEERAGRLVDRVEQRDELALQHVEIEAGAERAALAAQEHRLVARVLELAREAPQRLQRDRVRPAPAEQDLAHTGDLHERARTITPRARRGAPREGGASLRPRALGLPCGRRPEL